MILARVAGEVVATRKHRSHDGRKILVVQPINPDGSDRGNSLLALDAVDAGVGDRVLVVQEGYSAMTAVGRPNAPIDMSIVGVVDQIEVTE
jgi:microcompartment protein CcmK/EutM